MRYDQMDERIQRKIDTFFSDSETMMLREKALEIVRVFAPDCPSVDPEYIVANLNNERTYCALSWEYPGDYYPVGIRCKDDDEFVDIIVQSTLRTLRPKETE